MSAAQSRRLALCLALAFARPALAQPRDAPADAVLDEVTAPDEAPAASPDASPDEGAVDAAALPASPLAATELGALSGRACLRALSRSGVRFERLRWGASGMATPVVVTAPIEGVTFHAARAQPPRETMDCLLALALVRYARFLRSRGVREVRHLSLHRPPSPEEAARRPVMPRHPGGVAIDVGAFVLDDGTEYSVARDFRGRLGAPVCGPAARVQPVPEARFLRALFCDAARRGLFHVALSPNYNDEHRNHFHLEVARSVSWQFVR